MVRKLIVAFALVLIGGCQSAFYGLYEAIACSSYAAPVMHGEVEPKSCGMIPRCQALNVDGQVIRVEWEDGVKLKLDLTVVGDKAVYDNIEEVQLITEKPGGIFTKGERNALQAREWHRGRTSLEVGHPIAKRETYTLILFLGSMERDNKVRREIKYKSGKIKTCAPMV